MEMKLKKQLIKMSKIFKKYIFKNCNSMSDTKIRLQKTPQ